MNILDNLVFSLNATVPIFAVIVFGWIFKRIKLISDEFASVSNKLTFKVFLPVLLFQEVSRMKIGEDFSLKFCLACFLMTVTAVFIITLLSVLLIKDKTLTGSYIQGSFRGSAAILGVSIAQNLYGNAGMVPMMIVAAVPFYNVFSVIILTIYSRDSLNKKIDIKKLIFDVLKNPIIIAIILGLPFSLLNVHFPLMLEKTMNNLSCVASPLALLAIGAGFSFSGNFASKLKLIISGSLIKLVIQPAVFLPVAAMLGFREQEMIAILIMLGSPSTVSGYIMAKNMGNDAELASGIVVITTAFSAFSVTGFIYILRSFQLI